MKPLKNYWKKVCKETPPYNERVLIWTGYQQHIAIYIQENKFRIFDHSTTATHWDWLGRPPEKENE